MHGHQIRRYKTDEVIFREGEEGDCAYLIEKGRILIYLEASDGQVPLRILGEGEVFGEMALIDNSVRSASCKAVTESQLIIVTKEQLLDRVQAADPFVRLLMKILLQRLRSQNDRLRGKTSALIPTEELTPLDVEKRDAIERIGLENRIANGVAEDEFLPFYQPIYDIQNGGLKGCEALVRWVSKDGTVLAPNVFMDVMEESSLILQVGQIIMEKCMQSLPEMLAVFHSVKDFFISVNISGRQFAHPSFIMNLEDCRTRFQVDPKHIKLEVTERVMMEGPNAFPNLKACRDLGYQLAIDDFGTGFSSLQYLAQMPLTDLKIDRSFVTKMRIDPKSFSIIKSLIYMADLLNLKLIAEGIETQEELDILKGLSVQMGQGWLFAKALPLKDFLALSARYHL